MLKAGSLLYAIYICLLISILCGALMFIFNLNLEVSARQSVKNSLIDRCDSCFAYYLSDAQLTQNKNANGIDLFDDGIQCEFLESEWGVLTRLKVSAFFRTDTISRTALIGTRPAPDSPALYLCDWGDPLKISGNTKVTGDLKLPSEGFKKISLLGNSQLNRPEIRGLVSVSEQTLPGISLNSRPNFEITQNVALSKLKKSNTLFNSFQRPTLVVEIPKNEEISGLSLKGNIVLRSYDTLYLDKSSKLEDVIVTAPKIVVKNGFKGKVQLFAENEIFLEENVFLQYPSSLVIPSRSEVFEKKITISPGARVYGGIVLESQSFDQKEAGELIIKENTRVIGDVYCNGLLQLEGEVLGSVYAHKLRLQTKSGNHENTLLNASISSDRRPNGFVGLPLFSEYEKQAYGFIKNL